MQGNEGPISKCLGEIWRAATYSTMHQMTSVLYSFWKADDHQILRRMGTEEQLSRRLSYGVALTSHNADHHTFSPFQVSMSTTWPTSKLYSSHTETTHNESYLFHGCYVGPPTAMSNMLHNIQTDAILTSLPGPPAQMLTLCDNNKNNNKHIYKAPCMPTEGCRGAGVISVRWFGDGN